ncbi:Aste57867_15700 [Aphanomyces stellatus]|uniref:Aste57867_15700 protein n=1 Tax=Aphanomyces stellatus TaxID=120398 RepID=A0A485L4Q2_9STRA|nr:hypothetical protein As57867_015644 [Aphanomyces stellatus]VFT92492.1 Aste57867_15700 [Aphanomyces stellatus]
MANVWFALVDSKGEAYNGTSASKVKIPLDSDIKEFKDAVKEKYVDSHLKGIAQSDLFVYTNKAAFDGKDEPLGEGETIEDDGKLWTDPLFVVVSGPATLLDCIDGWIEPKNLCNGKGMRWKYQFDETLVGKLTTPLVEHYNAWESGYMDKTQDPLFMVLSGCGTGKSRMLDEMKELFKLAAVRAQHELQKRICDAYVFNVNFENGTSYNADFEESEYEVSVRMLYQLLGKNQTWFHFVADVKQYGKIPSITAVIEHLAIVEKKDEMTIILCVDGLQHLKTDGTTDDKLYRLLMSLCSIITTKTKFFLLAVCATTIHVPIQQMLASSSQKRIILVPPILCGADILIPENPSVGRLVDAMDGHGRALEILETVLGEYRDRNVDFTVHKLDPIIDQVWVGLRSTYGDLFQWPDGIYHSVLAAVLSGRKFSLNEQIPGAKMNVDTLLQYGLFRQEISVVESSGRITCAFVVLWWMVKKLPVFKDQPDNIAEFFTEYSDVSWGKFEKFVALYRTIKSVAFEKHQVNVGEFHSGACFGDIRGLSIREEYCRRVVQTPLKVITGTKKFKANDFTPREIADLDMESVFINASGASAADIFLKINLVKVGSTECVLETIQCKHEQAAMTEERFYEERRKAAGPSDLFLMITTGPSNNFVLPGRSGIVSLSDFTEYFGSFASRSYQYLISPNINTADEALLRRIPGIGVVRAKMIVDERTNGNYLTPLEAHERLSKKLPIEFLEAYTYEKQQFNS